MSVPEHFDWRPERQLAADLLEKAGVPIGPFAKYVESVRERRAARVGALLAQASSLAGVDSKTLLELASVVDRLSELVVGAIEAAARADAEKVSLLARVLAKALSDPDSGVTIDDSTAVLAVVIELDPIHVRALLALERTGPVRVDPGRHYEALPKPYDIIAAKLGSATLAAPVERALQDLALINPGVDFDEWHVHLVTPFGRRALEYLAGDDP